ncbi:trichohyalin-like [Pleurodeles waltl]
MSRGLSIDREEYTQSKERTSAENAVEMEEASHEPQLMQLPEQKMGSCQGTDFSGPKGGEGPHSQGESSDLKIMKTSVGTLAERRVTRQRSNRALDFLKQIRRKSAPILALPLESQGSLRISSRRSVTILQPTCQESLMDGRKGSETVEELYRMSEDYKTVMTHFDSMIAGQPQLAKKEIPILNGIGSISAVKVQGEQESENSRKDTGSVKRMTKRDYGGTIKARTSVYWMGSSSEENQVDVNEQNFSLPVNDNPLLESFSALSNLDFLPSQVVKYPDVFLPNEGEALQENMEAIISEPNEKTESDVEQNVYMMEEKSEWDGKVENWKSDSASLIDEIKDLNCALIVSPPSKNVDPMTKEHFEIGNPDKTRTGTQNVIDFQIGISKCADGCPGDEKYHLMLPNIRQVTLSERQNCVTQAGIAELKNVQWLEDNEATFLTPLRPDNVIESDDKTITAKQITHPAVKETHGVNVRTDLENTETKHVNKEMLSLEETSQLRVKSSLEEQPHLLAENPYQLEVERWPPEIKQPSQQEKLHLLKTEQLPQEAPCLMEERPYFLNEELTPQLEVPGLLEVEPCFQETERPLLVESSHLLGEDPPSLDVAKLLHKEQPLPELSCFLKQEQPAPLKALCLLELKKEGKPPPQIQEPHPKEVQPCSLEPKPLAKKTHLLLKRLNYLEKDICSLKIKQLSLKEETHYMDGEQVASVRKLPYSVEKQHPFVREPLQLRPYFLKGELYNSLQKTLPSVQESHSLEQEPHFSAEELHMLKETTCALKGEHPSVEIWQLPTEREKPLIQEKHSELDEEGLTKRLEGLQPEKREGLLKEEKLGQQAQEEGLPTKGGQTPWKDQRPIKEDRLTRIEGQIMENRSPMQTVKMIVNGSELQIKEEELENALKKQDCHEMAEKQRGLMEVNGNNVNTLITKSRAADVSNHGKLIIMEYPLKNNNAEKLVNKETIGNKADMLSKTNNTERIEPRVREPHDEAFCEAAEERTGGVVERESKVKQCNIPESEQVQKVWKELVENQSSSKNVDISRNSCLVPLEPLKHKANGRMEGGLLGNTEELGLIHGGLMLEERKGADTIPSKAANDPQDQRRFFHPKDVNNPVQGSQDPTPNRKTVKITRTFMLDGKEVSVTTSRIVTNDGQRKEKWRSARRLELRELRFLQKEEQRAQAQLRQKLHHQREMMFRRTEQQITGKKLFYDREIEALERHRRQAKEYQELQHTVRLQDSARRLKSEQEKAYAKRKPLLHGKREEEQCFVQTQQEELNRALQKLILEHKKAISAIDNEYLTKINNLKQARESVVLDLEKLHLNEKYHLFKEQVKEQHSQQLQQLCRRHEKDIKSMAHFQQQLLEELKTRHAQQRGNLLKVQRNESKARLSIFKENLKCQGIHPAEQKVRTKQFLQQEDTRQKEDMRQLLQKQEQELCELQQHQDSNISELQQMQAEKQQVLVEQEKQQQKRLEEEHAIELHEWRSAHCMQGDGADLQGPYAVQQLTRDQQPVPNTSPS